MRFQRSENGEVVAIEIAFLRRTVNGGKIDVPRYVGSQVCMNCHSGSEHGHQDIVWMRNRHANAYWRLAADWALYLAKMRPHHQDLEVMSDHEAFLAAGGKVPDKATCRVCHRNSERFDCAEWSPKVGHSKPEGSGDASSSGG